MKRLAASLLLVAALTACSGSSSSSGAGSSGGSTATTATADEASRIGLAGHILFTRARIVERYVFTEASPPKVDIERFLLEDSLQGSWNCRRAVR
jgi:hypothetical protein